MAQGSYVFARHPEYGEFNVAQARGRGFFAGKGHGALGLAVEEAEARMCANGHLIAAAPDLKAALKEARTDLMIVANNALSAAKTDPRWEGVYERLQIPIAKADAALSKAEGQSNE